MNLISWGEYRPDVADLNGDHSRTIDNVVPRADGFGPVKDATVYSGALGATCRGAFRALNSDGTISVFAASASKLYKLNNTTLEFENVSKTAGAHTYTLPSDQVWQFAQYDDFVVAVQGGDDVQVFELGVSSYFADLGGSPPRAKYVSIVNEFIVLSGLVSFPYRIHWSGRSSPTTWTSGTLECDFQDFVDGGRPHTLGGGEHSTIILQDYAIRLMVYQPGSPVIFSIERLSEDIGIVAPYSMIKSGQSIFFISNSGFQMMSTADNSTTPIGKERVDATFTGEWDDDNLQLTFGFSDPRGTRVFFAYKTQGATDGFFDKMLCYDWVLDRWSPVTGLSGEFVVALAQVGQTLEGLDDLEDVSFSGDTTSGSAVVINCSDTSQLYAGMWVTGSGIPASTTILSVDSSTQITLSANATATASSVALTSGGSLDSLGVSSLDAFPVAFGKEVAIFDSDHKMGFLNGDNLEATLETPEQGEPISQVFISGCRPISDAEEIYGQVSSRQHLGATRTWNTEAARDSAGLIPARVDTRYSRFRNRIPAGTVWTYSTGVVPQAVPTGNR